MRNLSWLCCVVLLALSAFADHPAEATAALGRPEHLLCGISVSSEIRDIMRHLGPPQAAHDDEGEHWYVWTRNGVRLEVFTSRALESDGSQGPEYIERIQVSGMEHRGKFGRTGRGLALGSSPAEARALYGSRCVSRLEHGKHMIYYEWEGAETLGLELDERGHIRKMMLFPPE